MSRASWQEKGDDARGDTRESTVNDILPCSLPEHQRIISDRCNTHVLAKRAGSCPITQEKVLRGHTDPPNVRVSSSDTRRRKETLNQNYEKFSQEVIDVLGLQ